MAQIISPFTFHPLGILCLWYAVGRVTIAIGGSLGFRV